MKNRIVSFGLGTVVLHLGKTYELVNGECSACAARSNGPVCCEGPAGLPDCGEALECKCWMEVADDEK